MSQFGDPDDLESQLAAASDQNWFWSEPWLTMEIEADADISAGRVDTFSSIDEMFAALEK